MNNRRMYDFADVVVAEEEGDVTMVMGGDD